MTIEVIVVGGGHAGVEAATASARRGAHTLLITHRHDTLGAMSCNPSIGGVGKGHLVREVDVFDGVMARAADAAAIHHRMLNAGKGKAVQGPRIQADRKRYAKAVRGRTAATPNLCVVEGEVTDLHVVDDCVTGVVLADATIVRATAVILATGTFLGGRVFRGKMREEGGRLGDRAASALGTRLREMKLPIARLKTGTPPRLDGRTIDWARIEPQPSDESGWTMSAMTQARQLPQIACGITRTNERTHSLIRRSLGTSPLFSGAIEGSGPRYCPSIEDKVTRFGDRDGHQIFLEPEGIDDTTIYPNGISTSLSEDAQTAMVASIDGLERAVITAFGYAVEYDHVDPRSLDHRLECSVLPGLFCAGQINGTTGYEEAAAQGLVAGCNAAASARDLSPLLLDRGSSYIGVMIDDLVLQGVTEPYRMLTSRAEYRLSLRADNAEARLAKVAGKIGCVGSERAARFVRREVGVARIAALLATPVRSSVVRKRGGIASDDGVQRAAAEWLRFPGMSLDHLAIETSEVDAELLCEAIEDARYAPYLARQAAEIAALRHEEGLALDASLDFAAIPGMSTEMAERLAIAGPPTLAAAARVRGVTPAALTAILLHIQRRAA